MLELMQKIDLKNDANGRICSQDLIRFQSVRAQIPLHNNRMAQIEI